jgi:NAD(P)-dependent dehydrogenase (short-subunit alcohol dehydrogenase family)
MPSLSGKVTLITGAGSGIGAATARLFAREGAKVALLGWPREELQAMAQEIAMEGGEILLLPADVTSEKEVTEAFAQLHNHWGQLDVLFSNAGINGTWAPLEELSAAEWDQTLNVNLRGTFLTTRASLPLLKVRGGSIIITSSVNGTRMFCTAGATAYACSKAGQVAFAKTAAIELARYQIRVNVICPGFIDSHIHEHTNRRGLEGMRHAADTPEGPIPLTGHTAGKPESVAELVLFLASERSGHITGTEVYIDGAQSLLQS